MAVKSLLLALCLLPAVPSRSGAQAPPGNQEQVDLHSRIAQQYLKENRPDLAIPELQKVIALDPANVDARGNLGVLLFFRKEYREAAPNLREAVRLGHDLWKIQALLGLTENFLGDGAASREDLETAFPHLQGEKIQGEVGQLLIRVYTANGDLEKAATVVSSLLAAQPTDASLLTQAYQLYSDLAGKAILTLAMVAPDSALMHQVMARELARHGDESAAIANYREAIKLDPRLPGIHSELGEVLYHSSDPRLKDESEAEFKAALAANSADKKALLMAGKWAELRGDNRSAYSDYSRALELDPNDTDACTEAAKILVLMDQREKAQQLFERAIRIDPSNFVAHYRLSTLYRQAGRTDDAKLQAAEYLKYKQLKQKLEKVFHDMRVVSGQNLAADEEEK